VRGALEVGARRGGTRSLCEAIGEVLSIAADLHAATVPMMEVVEREVLR
jgi:hypothetical protein